MKFPRILNIPSLQTQIALLCLGTSLLVMGASSLLFITHLKQNSIETIQWQAQTLTIPLLTKITERAPASPPAMRHAWLREFSAGCQQLFMEGVTHCVVFDADAHMIGGQEEMTSAETSVVNPEDLQALAHRQSVLIPEGGGYHLLLPMHNSEKRYLGAVDLGVPARVSVSRILLEHAGLLLLFICITGGGSFLLIHRVISPLRAIAQTSEKISAGDLSMTVHIQGRGEIRRLTRAFSEMAEYVRQVIRQLRQDGETIQQAAQEILSAIDMLAVSLEEQSSSALETSVTMERVVSASQQISKNTDAVVQIAQKTRADAQQGLKVAEDTLKKMQEIEQSNTANTNNIQILGHKSSEISKIIDTIVTIADQTKLIAFNASLEAAGAGSAGRRFGVVAEEIRNLADSVLGSSTHIRQTLADIRNSVQTLILSSEDSTQHIQEGVEYTVLTAEWLKEILAGTAKTTNAAQKISRSILGQQRASEEISTALKELSHNTEQFAQASVVSRDFAQKLESLSQELEGVITQFTLD